MTVKLYMDHHVPSAITAGLRVAGVDVLTAYEDNSHLLGDAKLLDRARQLERVLFTRDDDLLTEATQRQRRWEPFSGLIFAHQLRVSIGASIHDLTLLAQVGEPDDFVNAVYFLPL